MDGVLIPSLYRFGKNIGLLHQSQAQESSVLQLHLALSAPVARFSLVVDQGISPLAASF